MHLVHATLFAAMIAGLTAAGCATSATSEAGRADLAASGEPDPRRGEQVDRICFARNIDSFRETTRNSVVVRESLNDYYLIETFGACFNLDFAQSIGFDTRIGSCVRDTDRLIVSDSAFGLHRSGGLGTQSCQIRAIYRWDPEAPEAETEAETTDTPNEETAGGTEI